MKRGWQTLLVRELSPEFERVELIPFADGHAGDRLSLLNELDQCVAFVKEEPYRYIVCVGDLMNNNLKSSVGSVYEDEMSPREQKKYIKKLLTPVADRILCMVGGNHEYRTRKETDQDITADIADALGVPYAEDEINLKLSFGTKANKKRQVYFIHCVHGSSGGRRPGGVLNRIEELSMNILADVYIMAHAHRKMAHKARFRVPDLHNENIREVTQLYVVCSAWLRYGGYAARKQLRPQDVGAPVITLYAKEKRAEAVI